MPKDYAPFPAKAPAKGGNPFGGGKPFGGKPGTKSAGGKRPPAFARKPGR